MADIADRANDHMQMMLDCSLAKINRIDGISEPFCLECDGEIPERRRVALPGVTLCVGCQQIKEARER